MTRRILKILTIIDYILGRRKTLYQEIKSASMYILSTSRPSFNGHNSGWKHIRKVGYHISAITITA